jgi:hypothetical protein
LGEEEEMIKALYVLAMLGLLLVVASIPCCITDVIINPGSEKQILNDLIGDIGQILFWIGAAWALLAGYLLKK